MGSQANAAQAAQHRSVRIVKVALSIITVIWLALQFTAGVRQTNEPYPITGFSMFSYPTGGQATFYTLVTSDENGTEAELSHEDFGLTELQLATFITRSIGTSGESAAPDAEAILSEVASAYGERHNDPIDNLSAFRTDYQVGTDEIRSELIAAWSAR